jgi:hypothetical protein
MSRRGLQSSRRCPSAGSGFNPSSVANLAFWLRADLTSSLTIATGVSAWADLSGNGRNFTQATGSKQPTVSAGTGPLGLQVLNFASASSQFLQIASACALTATSMTLFVVGKSLSVASSMTWIDLGDTDTNEGLSIGTDMDAATGRNGFCGGVGFINWGTATTNWEAWCVQRNSTPTLSAWVNGAPASVVNAAGGVLAFNAQTSIGSQIGTGAFLNGSILEIFAYSSVLAANTVNNLNNYIRRRTALW